MEPKHASVQGIGGVFLYDCGRFAWITDPEGNRLELYQPLNG